MILDITKTHFNIIIHSLTEKQPRTNKAILELNHDIFIYKKDLWFGIRKLFSNYKIISSTLFYNLSLNTYF